MVVSGLEVSIRSDINVQRSQNAHVACLPWRIPVQRFHFSAISAATASTMPPPSSECVPGATCEGLVVPNASGLEDARCLMNCVGWMSNMCSDLFRAEIGHFPDEGFPKRWMSLCGDLRSMHMVLF